MSSESSSINKISYAQFNYNQAITNCSTPKENVDNFIKEKGFLGAVVFFEQACFSSDFNMVDKSSLQILFNRFVKKIFKGSLASDLVRRIAIAAEKRFDVCREFTINGEKIPFNPLLMMSYPIFRNLLAGSFQETTQQTINMKDIAPNAMRAILQFIHDDEIVFSRHFTNEEKVSSLCDILKAADYFFISDLYNFCKAQLLQLMNKTETALSILNAALATKDKKLANQCLSFIKSTKFFRDHTYNSKPWIISIPPTISSEELSLLMTEPLYQFIEGFDIGPLVLGLDNDTKENVINILGTLNTMKDNEKKKFWFSFKESRVSLGHSFYSSIFHLPCLDRVTYFNLEEAKNDRLVCILISFLSGLQEINLSKNLRPTQEILYSVKKSCPQLKKIQLASLESFFKDIVSYLEENTVLEEIVLDWNCLSNFYNPACRKKIIQVDFNRDYQEISIKTFKDFFESLKNLKILSARADDMRFDLLLEVIGKNCSKLEIVDFHKNRFVDTEGIIKLAEGCHELTDINLDSTSIDDEALFALSKHCKKLKSISLKDCDKITDKGIASLAEGCPELSYVKIDYCNIGDEAIYALSKHCKNLKFISFKFCDQITVDARLPLLDGKTIVLW